MRNVQTPIRPSFQQALAVSIPEKTGQIAGPCLLHHIFTVGFYCPVTDIQATGAGTITS